VYPKGTATLWPARSATDRGSTPELSQGDRTRFVSPESDEPHVVYGGDPAAVVAALERVRRVASCRRRHPQDCHRAAVRPAFPVGREGLGRPGSVAPLPTAMSP